MRKFLFTFISAISILFIGCNNHKTDYDIIIYGGTSAGVASAYSASLLGKSVLIIEPGTRLGGMSASGLGETDIGNKYAITGIGKDFYRRLGAKYHKFEAWRFEPHVASAVFQDMVNASNIDILYQYRITGAKKQGRKIKTITVENSLNAGLSKIYSAKIFIDASYEGDLMAKAGVSYHIGREANSQYNETLNGVQFHGGNQLPDNIDPYVIEGDSTSGLLWGISPLQHAPIGSGDTLLQAYCFRLCLTNNPDNLIPFTRPDNYDSTRFEVLRRVIKQRDSQGWSQRIADLYLRVMLMPNQKTDINNKGGFSLDYIGANWGFINATYQQREQIVQEHIEYTKGVLYFLSSDPAIPEDIKTQMKQWGWPKDEFTDNNNFPWQLYIREARRMVGEYVMTQKDCQNKTTINDGIAMGAYNMDSHNCQRIVVRKNGKAMVKNEGDVQEAVKPYKISYRSIVPKRQECTNLIVPVCMSATHIAYGSIRMEPVFMVMGQSAAVAASIAIDKNIAVQKVDIKQLHDVLTNNPLLDGSKPEITVDNRDSANISFSGNWQISNNFKETYYDDTHISSVSDDKTRRAIIKSPKDSGLYKLYYHCPEITKSNKELIFESTLPITIHATDGEARCTINLDKNQGEWIYVGEYSLNHQSFVEIIGDSCTGAIAVDALIYQPVQNPTSKK